jgi:restriction system protein
MSIPDYQSIMLPLLKFSSDKNEHSLRESIEYLANFFTLSESERKELLPSGLQAIFDNRVAWARTYLKKAGLIETTRRGFFRTTEQGLSVIKKHPSNINVKFLEQFPSFIEFRNLRHEKGIEETEVEEIIRTPEESIEIAYQNIKQNLAQEILSQVKSVSASFFEKLVIDLLVKMGYGGSRKDAGRAIGKSGDEGIDGIINEDRLGLDIIYVQAKRWGNTVSRPEIQKFVGALQGQRAKKGIFITTSDFTKEAIAYASNIETKIVLIDGEKLANLMIDFNIGVSSIKEYEVKRVDSDYFTEE